MVRKNSWRHDNGKLTSHSVTAGADKIVFFDHHHSEMTCHPWRKTKLTAQPAAANESNDKKLEIRPQLNYKAVPDLVGTEATLFEQYHKWKDARTKLSNSRGFPWHHVRTIVELKSGTVDKSERQTATYTGDVHHSRADLAGAYGLYASLNTPSTGVIAQVHTSLPVSSGLTSILSSNTSNPYMNRPMDIVMHMTRPSSSIYLPPGRTPLACSFRMTHTGVLPRFQVALSA